MSVTNLFNSFLNVRFFNLFDFLYLRSKKAFYRSKCKSFGENVIFFGNPVFYNMHNISLGSNVDINDGVIINGWSSIIVGDGVCLSAYSQLQTAGYDVRNYPNKVHVSQPIVLGLNVWVGAGAIILGGVTVGDNTVIGAGSVVTHDIPSNELWAGVPAKKIRNL